MTTLHRLNETVTEVSKQSVKAGWRVVRRATRPRDLRRLKPTDGPVRVILGAGRQHRDGWIATDLFPRGWNVAFLDVSSPFPFADGSVDRIYAEHMIEHVPIEAGERMLSEAHRVLHPGGRIRIATPDLAKFITLATEPVTGDQARYVREANALFLPGHSHLLDEPLVAVNRMFSGHGHCFLYNEALLTQVLERHGFAEIERQPVGLSSDPTFVGMEDHGRHIGEFCNQFETMVLEATRP